MKMLPRHRHRIACDATQGTQVLSGPVLPFRSCWVGPPERQVDMCQVGCRNIFGLHPTHTTRNGDSIPGFILEFTFS